MRKENNIISKNIKIAVLDDDQGIIDSVKTILIREGFSVWGTTDVKECMKELKDNIYDIFIVDYLMPSVRGDEVVRQISQFDTALYIIMLTGHINLAPSYEMFLKTNITAYCEKSPDFHYLLNAIYTGCKVIQKYKYILSTYCLEDNLTLGQLLKKIREDLGMSQQEVADGLVIDRGTISKYETGKRIPNIELLTKMSKFFGVDLLLKGKK